MTGGGPTGCDPGLGRRARAIFRNDAERAEELEQRTLVRVWELDTQPGREIRSPMAFRFGVLRKVHQEYLREERRHRHLELEGLSPTCTATPDPAQEVALSEECTTLREAIGKLRSTLKVVIQLRYFEGLQQRQIARHLDCNEVKICRLLKRARETLRLMLE